MNQDAAEIMSPDVSLTLPRSGETVIVKELNWKDQRQFFASLAPHADKFAKLDPKGGLQFDQAQLFATLLSTLGEQLIVSATGRTREWVLALKVTDFVTVLKKAVELNIRPEMIEEAKNLMGQLGMGKSPKLTSQTPTTSSLASEAFQETTSTPAP